MNRSSLTTQVYDFARQLEFLRHGNLMAQDTLTAVESSAAFLAPPSVLPSGKCAFVMWGRDCPVSPTSLHFCLKESQATFFHVDSALLEQTNWSAFASNLIEEQAPSMIIVMCKVDLGKVLISDTKKHLTHLWRRFWDWFGAAGPSREEARLVVLRQLILQNARIAESIRSVVGVEAPSPLVIEAFYDVRSLQAFWDLSREIPMKAVDTRAEGRG